VLVYTVASEPTDGYQRFMRSADFYNIKVTTLGMGQPWKGGDMNYAGGGYKVNLLKEALKPLKDDAETIVMFTDSYDVIFVSTLNTIVEKFKSTNSKVLFSAENYCWPDESLKKDYPPLVWKGARFLNSGMFIGTIVSCVRQSPTFS
jgi:procollagen-lysine,2-oxoglutarate 5-dioxygenase, invertebrate